MSEPLLPISRRPTDGLLAGSLSIMGVVAGLFDGLVVFDVPVTADSTYIVAQVAWEYCTRADPLLLAAPIWVRICVGLSFFVYSPFYLIAAMALVRGWSWIQIPALIVCTMACSFTGILFFGVELFGEPEIRSPDPLYYLAVNAGYLLVPLTLLIRMRRPDPFTRRF